jgi:Icc-related predicted phosphoesterase
MRIAAVGDIHCTRTSAGQLRGLFEAAGQAADVLVLCGDLTDFGLPEEAEILATELSAANVPIVAVLGNHDYESERQDDVRHILEAAGIHVLEGEAAEIDGVGFAGTKGFAGGFGTAALGAWGEPAIKAFVQAALDEARQLETALARVRAERRVVALHYAPIPGTVEGEPDQIWAWLGSERLEEPINRYGADFVVHGHAHHGRLEGRTRGGVPVYNVSRPLLRREGHEPGFRVFELPAREGRERARLSVAGRDEAR